LGDSYLKNPNPSILAECYRGIYVSLISASSADLIWFWLFHHSSCLVCVLAVFILEATDNIFLCNIWEKFTSFPSGISLYRLLILLHPQFDFYFGSAFRTVVGHTLQVDIKISSTEVTTAGQVEKYGTVNIYLWITKE